MFSSDLPIYFITCMHQDQNRPILPKEADSSPAHRCQFQQALLKAEKSLTQKAREILTLNRIIKNLREELDGIRGTNESHETELKSLRQEISALKETISALEMQRINHRQQEIEEFLHAAQDIQAKLTQRPSSRHSYRTNLSEPDPQYLAPNQTFFADKYMHLSPTARPVSSLNMGELFMGKKMTLDRSPSASNMGGWGRIQELDESDKRGFLDESRKRGFFSPRPTYDPAGESLYRGAVNIESALEDLRRQNQSLKTSLF